MRLITCAGYYRTGSSAISDFFSEFDNCTSLGSFEFRFVQDPDGISDLEYNLIENNHRHNTGYAIKRFLKNVDFLNGSIYSKRYRHFFDDKFYEYSMEYIKNIVKLEYNAWWHRDQIDKGKLFYFIDRMYSKIISLFYKEKTNVSLLNKEISYVTDISKEEFYFHTRNYITKLFEYANKNNSDFMMVDQIVPPSNINRYLNYFDDIKVISVDRDPRDLYVIEKTIYQWGIIPYKDVKTYCEWYRITREHRKHENDDSSKIIRINFEDLIYNYEETTNKLINFVGLNKINHTRKKKHFIPEESIKNINKFQDHKELLDDIKYIENNLSEYLYNFPDKA